MIFLFLGSAIMFKKDQLNPLGPLTEFDQFRRDIIPGFTILEQLGKGASGIVFLAKDHKRKKKIALKRNQDFRYASAGVCTAIRRSK